MSPAHHPPPEWLLDRASGALGRGATLAVDCHLALCPECRSALAVLDGVGGQVLDDTRPVALAPDSLARVLARLDAMPAGVPAPPAPSLGPLPPPLRPVAAQALTTGRWQALMGGIRVLDLTATLGGSSRVQILEIAGGRGVPRHDHGGREVSVVLTGAFVDGDIRCGVGDLQVKGPGEPHRPIAVLGEVCRVLVVAEAAPRLTGLLGAVQRLVERLR